MSSAVTVSLRNVLSGLREWGGSLAAMALLYRTVGFVLLFPLAGLLLRLVVSLSGDSVVTDADIALFLLHPLSCAGLIIAGAVLLTLSVLEQVCLLRLAASRRQGQSAGILAVLRAGLSQAVPVLQVTVRVFLSCAGLALPFLAVAGLMAWWLLTEHDINYYLSRRPPEFLTAAVTGGVLGAVLAALLIRRLSGWLAALPMLVFEQTRPGTVLADSGDRMAGRRLQAVILLALWFLITAVAGSVVTGGLAASGRLLLPALTDSTLTFVPVLLLLTALWLAAQLLITLVQSSGLALCLLEIYVAGRPDGLTGDIAVNPETVDATPRMASLPTSRARRLLFPGLATLAALAAATGTVLVASAHIDDDVLVIAHRGAAGRAPENTLAAVRRAIEDGADVVEIDVQETESGEVVVIHDRDLMRVAGRPLRVRNARPEQLAQIDVGSFFDPRFADERVPTLRDVLDICRDRVTVDIELKYYGEEEQLEERVARIVKDAGMESQVILMSLEYDAVKRMKALQPEWTVGLLTAAAIGDLTRREADFLAVNAGLFSTQLVRDAHARGRSVYVWTVNDAARVAWFAGLGADGVITDHPAMARSVLEARAEQNPLERLLVNLAFRLGVVPRNQNRQAKSSGNGL